MNKNKLKQMEYKNECNGQPTLADLINVQKKEEVYVSDYGTITDIYISSKIGPASEYVDLFQRIRAARESDILRFHINCPGGDLFTTIQFMQVLSETSATVVMSVEGACMSAATLLFLMGDEYMVTEHSIFLFHNYSGGVVGKGAEIFHGIMHERKWTEGLLNDAYEDFLTKDEIEQLIEDKDVWMDAKTVMKRLQIRGKETPRNKYKREVISCEEEEEKEEVLKPSPKKKTTKRKKKIISEFVKTSTFKFSIIFRFFFVFFVMLLA